MKSKIMMFLLVLSLMFSACKTNNIAVNDNPEPVTLEYSSIHYTMNRIFTITQIDSMITVDKLSPLNTWITSTISYKGKQTKQYMFIKSLQENGELIYSVTDLNNKTYKCTKRITEDK